MIAVSVVFNTFALLFFLVAMVESGAGHLAGLCSLLAFAGGVSGTALFKVCGQRDSAWLANVRSAPLGLVGSI